MPNPLTCLSIKLLLFFVTLSYATERNQQVPNFNTGGLIKASDIQFLRDLLNSKRSGCFINRIHFTDEAIVPQETPIKKIHLTELRQGVIELNSVSGLRSHHFTDENIVVGETQVKAVHFSEILTSLNNFRCPSPINCVGSWSACSVTCGGGTQTYTINTPAAFGGTSCPYQNGAINTCNMAACCSCNWTNNSCNSGGCSNQRLQTYTCNSPSCPGHGSGRCVVDSSCTPPPVLIRGRIVGACSSSPGCCRTAEDCTRNITGQRMRLPATHCEALFSGSFNINGAPGYVYVIGFCTGGVAQQIWCPQGTRATPDTLRDGFCR
ncbi:MAG: thrombospondin type-1 domain-containing protein [Bdellovibrionales bacterium]|nr:thrombospondin type-1 domain-containing protein [Bdellovibrionales bacterium]